MGVILTNAQLSVAAFPEQNIPLGAAVLGLAVGNTSTWTLTVSLQPLGLTITMPPLSYATMPTQGTTGLTITGSDLIAATYTGSQQLTVDKSSIALPLNVTPFTTIPSFTQDVNIQGTPNVSLNGEQIDVNIAKASIGTLPVSATINSGQTIGINGNVPVTSAASTGLPITTGTGGLTVDVNNTLQITNAPGSDLSVTFPDTQQVDIASATIGNLPANVVNEVINTNNLVYFGQNSYGVANLAAGAKMTNLSTTTVNPGLYDGILILLSSSGGLDDYDVAPTGTTTGVLFNGLKGLSSYLFNESISVDTPDIIYSGGAGNGYSLWTFSAPTAVGEVAIDLTNTSTSTIVSDTVTLAYYAVRQQVAVNNPVTNPLNQLGVPMSGEGFTTTWASDVTVPATFDAVASGHVITQLQGSINNTYLDSAGTAGVAVTVQILNGTQVVDTLFVPPLIQSNNSQPTNFKYQFVNGVPNDGISFVLQNNSGGGTGTVVVSGNVVLT